MDNSFIKIHFHVVIKFWSVFDLLYEKIGRLNDVAFFWTFRFVNLKMCQFIFWWQVLEVNSHYTMYQTVVFRRFCFSLWCGRRVPNRLGENKNAKSKICASHRSPL